MTTGNRWRMHGDSRGPGNPERLVRRRVVSLPDLRGAGTSVTDEDSGGGALSMRGVRTLANDVFPENATSS